jgi:hypothetical protein
MSEQERRRARVWTHSGWEVCTHGGIPVAFARYPWLRDPSHYRDGGPAEPGDLTEHELSEHICGIRGPDVGLLCPLVRSVTKV